MSHHHLPPFPIFFSLLFSLLPQLPALPVLPNPDPASIQQQQTFLPNPSPPATIPSFPEQSAVAGCPLSLNDEIFPAVKASCNSGHLRRGKCCPVLAAWLYSAYTNTTLGKGAGSGEATSTYDLPMLPDDSETCVDGLEKVMKDKGVNLVKINETCDVVYCYCGIRLHQLSCPQAFHVSEDGRLAGDKRVMKLEKDCLSSHKSKDNDHSTLATCSKCLHSLYSLKKGNKASGNGTKLDIRTSKMRSRDCELMGLTWLLHKDRDTYISTVTSVMRALMLNVEGADPQSCSISSNGLPLAVDSAEIDGQSSSESLQFPLHLCLFMFFLLIMSSSVLS
ncbi:uncharacterized GPI-anchored protein At4g28100-like [Chenopodium quinoa]|uniref:SPARK domain-containing protein n=1 Tax=Chenopodium quinoa TaxID=63459 RepID=A0A803N926_CHEQI|nr:uncharacterized GPI-anchored protein At4g28100-like [Chenopodium quinoa]